MRMTSRFLEVFLNIFGIFYFRYNRKSNSVNFNGFLMIFSISVFVIIELILYCELKYSFANFSDIFEILSCAETVLWDLMYNILFLEKLFNFRKYLRIMNKYLTVECYCSAAYSVDAVNKALRKKYRIVFWCFIGYFLLYIPVDTDGDESVWWTFVDFVYDYTFLITFVVNILAENFLFYKIKLHFSVMISNINERVLNSSESLKRFIVAHEKLMDQMEEMTNAFNHMKLMHIMFVYSMVPLYIFFLQFGFSNYGNSFVSIYVGNASWMLVLVFMLTSCAFYEMPIDEVTN